MSAKGLRARFQQRRTEPSDRVELGASSANAYFTSKRIRQRVPRKVKPLPRKERQAPAAPSQPNANTGKLECKKIENPQQIDALQFPPRRHMLAQLQAIDKTAQQPRDSRFELNFSTWKSELLAGYNLLFYGVGSKLSLLHNFASSFLTDGVVMQVHGYLNTVSLKFVVEVIQQKIMHMEVKRHQSLVQQCEDIAKVKPSTQPMHQLYLLVHSIDGLVLRNAEAQTCLSWLAKSPLISLVATMDHINGPSIWKEEDLHRFEWLSQNVDTCEPYTDEIEMRLTKGAKSADNTSNGVKFILRSLTPTDIATLQELARQQLAASDVLQNHGRKPRHRHAPYQSVYEACHRKLLHSTPLAMKNSVKCLEDHGLLKQSRVNTVEYLEIPLPEVIIKTDILRAEVDD